MNVTVVGIGAMGGNQARSLLASSCTKSVAGYDRSTGLVASFHAEAREVSKAASDEPPTFLRDAVLSEESSTDAVVLVLVNEAQCDAVCFGGEEEEGGNLISLLRQGSCVVLCSTVTATWAKKAAERFAAEGVLFVDCPISGGPARAAKGDLALMASGSDPALDAARPLLDAMGRPDSIHVLPGGPGMGSTAKMVHQLLAGVHVAVAAEALSLAAKAGVNVRQMYDVVTGAAGMSWMFGDRGSRMISDEDPPPVMSAVDIFLKDLGIVRTEARDARSPVPVAAAALQQFVAARGLGLGREDDSRVVKAYEAVTGVPVGGRGGEEPSAAAVEGSVEPGAPLDACVVGIGLMGGGIARSLLRSSATRTVVGYDRAESLASTFFDEAKEAGKSRGDAMPTRLGDAVSDQTDAVVLVLVNERQCNEVCFGQSEENLLSLMTSGSCVVLCSTVTATWAKRAAGMFAAKGIHFVDSPISGGPVRAKSGELTMMASGDSKSLAFAMPLLNAAGKDVHLIPGGAGFGSTVKMVHQLLAGVHVVCAAEALALAAKMGIDPKQMYDIVNGAAGASWMFADRGKRMIEAGKPDVMSAVDIFVKDLDIVLSEAGALGCPVPIASAALQQFIGAQGMGLGREDDSQVIRLYEQITGVKQTM